MKSRMEKYNDNFLAYNRTERNRELYREVNKSDLSITKSYSNSKVIDEANKEIDIEKIKRFVEKMNDENSSTRKRIDDIQVSQEDDYVSSETKDYDLNSVLEKARSKREVDYESVRSRRINHSYNDIISQIEKYNSEINKDEDDEELNTNEQTLVNLINTISMNKKEADLFEELKGSENTQVLGNINEMAQDNTFKDEIKKQISTTGDFGYSFDKTLDSATEELKENKPEPEEVSKPKVEQLDKTSDSFYTTSDIFDKKDFEQDSSEDDDFDNEKVSPLKTIGIIIAIIILIAVIVVVANYVFELGLF